MAGSREQTSFCLVLWFPPQSPEKEASIHRAGMCRQPRPQGSQVRFAVFLGAVSWVESLPGAPRAVLLPGTGAVTQEAPGAAPASAATHAAKAGSPGSFVVPTPDPTRSPRPEEPPLAGSFLDCFEQSLQWKASCERKPPISGCGSTIVQPPMAHSGMLLKDCIRECLRISGCRAVNAKLSRSTDADNDSCCLDADDVSCWLLDDPQVERCVNDGDDFKLFPMERSPLQAVGPQECSNPIVQPFAQLADWWRAVSERRDAAKKARAAAKKARLPSPAKIEIPVGSSHELVGSSKMTYQHVLLNPSIMMLPGHTDGPEAEVLVVARRLYFGTSGIVLPGETEPPKLWESSLVTVVVPLKRLLEAAATNAGEQIAVEFKHVQVDGDSCIETKNESGSDTKHCEYGGVHPCIPDRCQEQPITQLAVGPEDPRLFTCCGGKTFLLDFRSAASTQTTQQCSAFCGRQQVAATAPHLATPLTPQPASPRHTP